MLIVLFLVTVIVICIILSYKKKIEIMPIIIAIISIFLIFCITEIVSTQIKSSVTYAKYQMEYASIQKKQQLIHNSKNTYLNPVLQSKVITEIKDWNEKVYSIKYWGNNLFTNWFYDSRLVEDLKYISIDD